MALTIPRLAPVGDRGLDASAVDFWGWAFGDLRDNTNYDVEAPAGTTMR